MPTATSPSPATAASSASCWRPRERTRGRPRGLDSPPMSLLKGLFWSSAAALAWTHVGYPAAAAAAARLRPRPVRRGDGRPSVSIVVAAHDEEDVIERRLRNLLELDYP